MLFNLLPGIFVFEEWKFVLKFSSKYEGYDPESWKFRFKWRITYWRKFESESWKFRFKWRTTYQMKFVLKFSSKYEGGDPEFWNFWFK